MNVELPRTRPYDALFVVGTRLAADERVEQIGSIIVKAAYRLESTTGADTHRMRPDTEHPEASRLVLSDDIVVETSDVAREADIAPFKPESDVVVEGFMAGLDADGAQVHVDGTWWLKRIEDRDEDGDVDDEDIEGLPERGLRDRARHLFGYQPRAEEPRKSDATAASGAKPRSLDEFTVYHDRFLNYHRRGGNFEASAAVANPFASGQRLTVRKADQEAFALTLELPPLHALYRTYCGHGPDEPPYWTRIRLGAMRADTLILLPDAERAEVIWRAVWPWHDAAVDRYRAVRVTEGAS
jgi:hypothetical protein